MTGVMKKFVLKVIGISVLAIFTVVCLTYAAFMLFAPGFLADFHDGIGNYNKAASYAYKVYEKSGETSDLDKACKFALKTENDLVIVKYLSVLVDCDGFSDYCKEKYTFGDDYYDFMCGKYVCSLYLTEADKKAPCDKANAYSAAYTKNCALRALMFEAAEARDKETLKYIKELLSARTSSELIQSDIDKINELI